MILASLPHYALRIGLVVAALAIWFWTQWLIGKKSTPQSGLSDAVHRWTASWHRYLTEHPRAADLSLIVSSLLIDAVGLFILGSAIFGKSLAPFIALVLLFVLRQICQGLCTLPPPAGIIWRDPGFPTLLVTYSVSNDLFFSGHTALAVLGAMELAHIAPWWVGVVGGIIALAQALLVLVLRAHYTLDVIAACFAAYFAHQIGHGLAAQWGI